MLTPAPNIFTPEDADKALTEGWLLSTDDFDRLEIQRRDENPVFASDTEAYLYVLTRAHRGDNTTRRALTALTYDRIERDLREEQRASRREFIKETLSMLACVAIVTAVLALFFYQITEG